MEELSPLRKVFHDYFNKLSGVGVVSGISAYLIKDKSISIKDPGDLGVKVNVISGYISQSKIPLSEMKNILKDMNILHSAEIDLGNIDSNMAALDGLVTDMMKFYSQVADAKNEAAFQELLTIFNKLEAVVMGISGIIDGLREKLKKNGDYFK